MIPDSIWIIVLFALVLVCAGLWNRALRAEALYRDALGIVDSLRSVERRTADLWDALHHIYMARILTIKDQERVRDVLAGGGWAGPDRREGAA